MTSSIFARCLLVALIGLACSNDAPSSPADMAALDRTAVPDVGLDQASAADQGQRDLRGTDRPLFADTGARDASLDRTPVADQGRKDLAAADRSRIDGDVPDPGPVQCRVDGDCASGQSCNRTAPGGICLGCGTCLDPIDFACLAGACARICRDDGACNAGMRCSNAGYCIIRTCSSNQLCPAPYTCGSTGHCVRPACSGGTSCPAPLTCQAGLCIEP